MPQHVAPARGQAPCDSRAADVEQRGDALAGLLARCVGRRGAEEPSGEPATPAPTPTGQRPTLARAKLKTTPRRSGRVRVQTDAIEHQVNWVGPIYGPVDPIDGGTSVHATLGPAAGRPSNYGSRPGAGACPAVNWLNQTAYLGKAWIKGHLLNDNLGGPGVSKNLTPMSHTANMRFQGQFESKVKRALDRCYSHGRSQRGATRWYGVRMSAVARLQPGSSIPWDVTGNATYVAKPKTGGPAVSIPQPPWATALPAAPVVVNCSA
ncbi:MAG TPA: hypothetical protein VHZ31_05915 [Solirubrobacteraceae bacterium]|nr:hypothetical protein [Solirubrobacteraceae bacterium]